MHLAADALLQVIADVALAHGTALGQVHLRRPDGVVGRGEGVLDHADLRAVAMGDDDLVALFDEAEERVGSIVHALNLLRGRIAQRIAAECDDDTVGFAKRLGHGKLPFLTYSQLALAAQLDFIR